MTRSSSTIDVENLQDIAALVMGAAEAETLEETLQHIADASRELVGTKYAALGVPDGKGGLRHFRVSGITTDEIAKIEHPPIGEGLLGVIMNERETVVLDDIASDPRSVGFPHGHPPMTTMLGVPIQASGTLFGMLYLSDKEDGRSFEPHDRWLVETLAGYAALAIVASEFRDNQRRITLLEERQRIGMELHDGVIQSLYAIGMHLDLIRTGIMEAGSIDQAIEGLNTVIDDIRAYILNLKRHDDEESADTIRNRLEDIVSNLYITPDTTVSINAPDAAPDIQGEAYESVCMIAREALSNAVRHAQADYITVRCELDSNELRLLVRDNGLGFNLFELDGHQGLGLRNMRVRAEQLSGALEIETEPGHGTAVIVSIPINGKG